MFRRRDVFALSILFLLVLAVSCHAYAETDEEIRKIADPMMDNILQAMKTNNYENYCRDLDNIMKKAMTKEKFLKGNEGLKQRYGDFKSKKFHTLQSIKEFRKIIWRANFSKAKNDVSLQLVLKKYGKKWKVSGLWFFDWK